MKYVDAEWVTDPIMNTATIKATGDDGNIYWVPSIDTDVPPWPLYLKDGGTVKGTPPPQTKPAGA